MKLLSSTLTVSKRTSCLVDGKRFDSSIYPPTHKSLLSKPRMWQRYVGLELGCCCPVHSNTLMFDSRMLVDNRWYTCLVAKRWNLCQTLAQSRIKSSGYQCELHMSKPLPCNSSISCVKMVFCSLFSSLIESVWCFSFDEPGGSRYLGIRWWRQTCDWQVMEVYNNTTSWRLGINFVRR